MTLKKHTCRKGASLIEAMAAITVLSIAVFGGSAYRYHSTLDARRADRQMAAARTALMLCESWKGVQGDQTYDPTAHLGSDLAISTGSGPEAPEGFTQLGSYEVVSNDVTCYVTLSWNDVTTGLRALNVAVDWAQRDLGETSLDDVDKTFRLTTYTLN
jgi:hypothetical protein